MAKYKVAINGFGRIGRLSLRSTFTRDPDKNLFEVVAVNSRTPASTLGYLFKYDSVYRRFPGDVVIEDKAIVINGHRIQTILEPDPAKLPWKELGIDLVLECTGKLTKGNKSNTHLEAGAKKVIISAAAAESDATIVYGVNEGIYDPVKHDIISNASCTTNCLAPMCKVLHEKFGIVEGLMNTVHSYTNDQVILDRSHKTLSRGRGGALSIIPTTTGAAKTIGVVMPELQGRLNGFALRVPTPTVSVVDLTANLAKAVTKEDVNAAMKEYSEGELRGILGYETDDVVSMDFVGDSRSAIFAPNHTLVMGDRLVKVLAWYDNEWGYSCRMIDLANYVLSKGL